MLPPSGIDMPIDSSGKQTNIDMIGLIDLSGNSFNTRDKSFTSTDFKAWVYKCIHMYNL